MNLFASLKNAMFPGYSVKLQGRAGILYCEGPKEMAIDSEMLVGKFDYVVYLGTMSRWLPPHDKVPVSSEDKERITRNLARALKSLSIDWDTSWTPTEANKAPEPTTMAVTPRAPSSTSRAGHGRGSS